MLNNKSDEKTSRKSTILITVLVTLILLIISFIQISNKGLYVPGFEAKAFKKEEKVPLMVNKVVSEHKTYPFEYYDLPVCKGSEEEKSKKKQVENLGEILLGDRIIESNYELKMLVKEDCKTLCSPFELKEADINQIKELVEFDYKAEWLLDSLPVAVMTKDKISLEDFDTKFSLGNIDKDNTYYYNHVNIKVHYHEAKKELGDTDNTPKYNVVFFEVQPVSIDYGHGNEQFDNNKVQSICMSSKNFVSKENLLYFPKNTKGSTKKILYTYSVEWTNSSISWSQRWDKYIAVGEGEIHWFSIINSLLIVLFLSGMVAMILTRTLRNDCMRYNSNDPEEVDETGWKQIYKDIFRKPKHPTLFAVLIGSGVQVLSMAVLTLAFALLGFLSPANRGGLMTSLIFLYCLMGIVAGYFSTRVLKIMGEGDKWDVVKRTTLFTATFFPGILFGIIFILNFFLWGELSSSAIPFGTMMAIIGLWFGVSTPLCFIGSYFGFKKPAPQLLDVNLLAKNIPDQPWYMHPFITVMMGGVLPFGAVFIELYFILTSIWLQKFYYLFGFLFIVFLILVITCSEITIVMCYFHLCSEDYHWWWRSFATGGATGLYTFLYSLFYLSTKLELIGFVSKLLYVGYSFAMSLCVAVVTGMIGFYSCYYFIISIYGSIKLE